jgi:ribonuclease HI
MPFYAVHTGHIQSKVFTTWDECKREGMKRPMYKKCATLEEATRFAELGTTVDSSTCDVIVYTDGACRNNGKATAVAGYGVYFGPKDPRNCCGRIAGKATNNIAELTAILKALELVDLSKSIAVYTDSNYAILCCTTYGAKCEKKGYDGVPNAALVKQIYALVSTHNIKMVYVAAHTGRQDVHSLGNSEADRLATSCLG